MDDINANTAGQLKAFIERLERLSAEAKAVNEDITEIYSEAKATGFDPKILRKIVALRKLDASERQEQEALVELYMRAIGMGF